MLKKKLPPSVKLVAVSKFHPFESIEEAYAAGQRCFAESRPQELYAKIRTLQDRRVELDDPDYMSDIQWHFIGHLQTNKLKMVLPYVSLVQSVDSIRLLDAIDAWGRANGKVVDVLVEPHVAAEDTKQGFSPEQVISVLSDSEKYTNIRFRGIMGMGTFTDDEAIIRSDFSRLKSIYESASESLHSDVFTELSIGMSDDYELAIEYGSTMVRIGSMIFGQRSY